MTTLSDDDDLSEETMEEFNTLSYIQEVAGSSSSEEEEEVGGFLDGDSDLEVSSTGSDLRLDADDDEGSMDTIDRELGISPQPKSKDEYKSLTPAPPSTMKKKQRHNLTFAEDLNTAVNLWQPEVGGEHVGRGVLGLEFQQQFLDEEDGDGDDEYDFDQDDDHDDNYDLEESPLSLKRHLDPSMHTIEEHEEEEEEEEDQESFHLRQEDYSTITSTTRTPGKPRAVISGISKKRVVMEEDYQEEDKGLVSDEEVNLHEEGMEPKLQEENVKEEEISGEIIEEEMEEEVEDVEDTGNSLQSYASSIRPIGSSMHTISEDEQEVDRSPSPIRHSSASVSSVPTPARSTDSNDHPWKTPLRDASYSPSTRTTSSRETSPRHSRTRTTPPSTTRTASATSFLPSLDQDDGGEPTTAPTHPAPATASSSSLQRFKPLSPFSPKARKIRQRSTATTQNPNDTHRQLHPWSMQSSRKVSILVNVSSHSTASGFTDDDPESSLCLYPNVDQGPIGDSAASISFSTYHSPTRSVLSQATALTKAGPGQEVLLVNPDAFGNVLPTTVTMETARLVAHIGNKSSEDWVRKFRFDEVCWPDHRVLMGIEKEHTNATMMDVSCALVSDVLEGRNSAAFGYGAVGSGRLESMFGAVAGNFGFQYKEDATSIGYTLGLLGLITSQLIHKRRETESNFEFTVSMIEIVEEDVLRDLLSTETKMVHQRSPLRSSMSPSRLVSNKDEKSLKIRHPDTKGAIVQNASDVAVESITDVMNLVKRAFHSKNNKKSRVMSGGRGHVIATLKVRTKSKDKRKQFNYSMIQLLDLASAESELSKNSDVMGRTKLEMRRIQERRMASIRKSYSSLRGILRGQIVKEQQKNSHQAMSYRECTLTKLVQRALDNEKSRSVVISSVCPKRNSYEKSLNTLNYINRLLVRPSQTAEFPFETRGESGTLFSPSLTVGSFSGDQSVASSVASDIIRAEFANKKANSEFLKSLVTDPRQRLATLLKDESPTRGQGNTMGVPMTEITTIKEIDNEIQGEIEFDDSRNPDYNPYNTVALDDSFDASTLTDKYFDAPLKTFNSDNEAKGSIDGGGLDQTHKQVTFDISGESNELDSDAFFDEKESTQSSIYERHSSEESHVESLDDISNQYPEPFIPSMDMSLDDNEEGNSDNDSLSTTEQFPESEHLNLIETPSLADAHSEENNETIGSLVSDMQQDVSNTFGNDRIKEDPPEMYSIPKTASIYNGNSTEESKEETRGIGLQRELAGTHTSDLSEATTKLQLPLESSDALVKTDKSGVLDESSGSSNPIIKADPPGMDYTPMRDRSVQENYFQPSRAVGDALVTMNEDVRARDSAMAASKIPIDKHLNSDKHSTGEKLEKSNSTTQKHSIKKKEHNSAGSVSQAEEHSINAKEHSFERRSSYSTNFSPVKKENNSGGSVNKAEEHSFESRPNYSTNISPVKKAHNSGASVSQAEEHSMNAKDHSFESRSSYSTNFSPARKDHSFGSPNSKILRRLEEEMNDKMDLVASDVDSSSEASLSNFDEGYEIDNATMSETPYQFEDLVFDGEKDKVTPEDESIENITTGIDSKDLNVGLTQLEKSLRKLVENTNESELISELVSDRLQLQSFLDKGNDSSLDSSRAKLKQMINLSDALQPFMNSVLLQLRNSQEAEYAGKLAVSKLQSQMHDNYDKIQSLKSSLNSSVDRINEDHLASIEMAMNKANSKLTEDFETLQEQLHKEREARERTEKLQIEETDAFTQSLKAKIDENEALSQNVSLLRELISQKDSQVKFLTKEVAGLEEKSESLQIHVESEKRLVSTLSSEHKHELFTMEEVLKERSNEKNDSMETIKLLQNELNKATARLDKEMEGTRMMERRSQENEARSEELTQSLRNDIQSVTQRYDEEIIRRRDLEKSKEETTKRSEEVVRSLNKELSNLNDRCKREAKIRDEVEKNSEENQEKTKSALISLRNQLDNVNEKLKRKSSELAIAIERKQVADEYLNFAKEEQEKISKRHIHELNELKTSNAALFHERKRTESELIEAEQNHSKEVNGLEQTLEEKTKLINDQSQTLVSQEREMKKIQNRLVLEIDSNGDLRRKHEREANTLKNIVESSNEELRVKEDSLFKADGEIKTLRILMKKEKTDLKEAYDEKCVELATLSESFNDHKGEQTKLETTLKRMTKEKHKLEQCLELECSSRRTEKELHASKLFTLTNSLDKLSEQKEKLSQSLSKITDDRDSLVVSLDIQKEEMTNQRRTLSHEVASLKEKLHLYGIKENNLLTNINALTTELKALSDNLEREKVARKEENEAHSRKVLSFVEAIETSNQVKANLEASQKDLKEEKRTLESRLQTEIQTRKEEEESHSVQILEVMNALEHANQTKDELSKSLISTKGDNETLRKRLEEEIVRIATMEDDYDKKLSSLKNEISLVELKKQLSEKKLSDYKEKIDQLDDDLVVERAHIETIEKDHAEKLIHANHNFSLKKEELGNLISNLRKDLSSLQAKHNAELLEKETIAKNHEEEITAKDHMLSERSSVVEGLAEELTRSRKEIGSLKDCVTSELKARDKLEKRYNHEISVLTQAGKQSSSDKVKFEETIESLYKELGEEKRAKKDMHESNTTYVKSLIDDIARKDGKIVNLTTDLSATKLKVDSEASRRRRVQKSLSRDISALKESTLKSEREKSEAVRALRDVKDEINNIQNRLDLESKAKHNAENAISKLKQLNEAENVETERTILERDLRIRHLEKDLIEKNTTTTHQISVITKLRKRVDENDEGKEIQVKEMQKLHDKERKRLDDEIVTLRSSLLDEETRFNAEKAKLAQSTSDAQLKFERMKLDLEDSLKEGESNKSKLEASIRMLKEDLFQKSSQIEQLQESLDVRSNSFSRDNQELREKMFKEIARREKVEKNNKNLKKSLQENDDQVREEFEELKIAMQMTLSDKDAKMSARENDLKRQLDDDKVHYTEKITSLEAVIRGIRQESAEKQASASLADEMQREISSLRITIQNLEEERRHSQGGGDNFGYGYPPSADLRREIDLRMKAEEFAAAMAARAKAGLEKKNEEIVKLRLQLSTIKAEQRRVPTGLIGYGKENSREEYNITMQRKERETYQK